MSTQASSDFPRQVDCWVEAVADRGICIRGRDPHKSSAPTGDAVTLFDARPDPTSGTGASVEVAKVEPRPQAGGRWDTDEMTAQGPQLTVVLNGTTTVDPQDGPCASGPVARQDGAGVVTFRTVESTPRASAPIAWRLGGT